MSKINHVNEQTKAIQTKVLIKFASGDFDLKRIDPKMLPGPGFVEKIVIAEGLEKHYIQS